MAFNIFIHMSTVMISIGRCDSHRVLYSTNRNAYMLKVDNSHREILIRMCFPLFVVNT